MHGLTNNVALHVSTWLRPDGDYEPQTNDDFMPEVKFEDEPKWDKNGVSFKEA